MCFLPLGVRHGAHHPTDAQSQRGRPAGTGQLHVYPWQGGSTTHPGRAVDDRGSCLVYQPGETVLCTTVVRLATHTGLWMEQLICCPCSFVTDGLSDGVATFLGS